MELTADEKRNGWTKESLKRYHNERYAANAKTIAEPRIVKPQSQERYKPLRWRE